MLRNYATIPLVVEVSLDPAAKPPVSVCPDPITVKEPTLIIWQISASSVVKDFYFFPDSLDFATGAGIINHQVVNNRYAAFDTCTSTGEFAYVLLVEHQGKYYGTGSMVTNGHRSPAIRNR